MFALFMVHGNEYKYIFIFSLICPPHTCHVVDDKAATSDIYTDAITKYHKIILYRPNSGCNCDPFLLI